MNLNDIRKDIDEIDAQLSSLIKRRMDCSKRVAEYKRANGLPVFDAVREAAILDKLSLLGGEYANEMRSIYATIMEQSKALQYPYVESAALREFKPLTDHADVCNIACQGVPGAYSALTGARLYPNAKITYCASFADVCKAVHDGTVEYGILPVENSWAGSVNEVYDLLISGKFLIAECVDAHISHNLIGLSGADISSITRVLSHPQALRQCAALIDELGCEPVEYSNTAAAVRAVAQGCDSSCAAIGSSQAARQYGLEILRRRVASSAENTTRFISVSRSAQRSADADKISIVFSIERARQSGSLCDVLAHFASGGMSLSKLESRPIHGRSFEYMFYADFSGSLDDRTVAGILATMATELPDFTLLGNYRESRMELD